MRHRRKDKTLDRAPGPRKALLRGLATSVILYEHANTTLAKAKVVRPIVEKIITRGKTKSLANRRKLAEILTVESAVNKVIEELGPRYAKRAGGYTRIIRKGRRLGDAGEIVVFELVKSEEQKADDRRKRLEAAEAKDMAKAEGEETPKAKAKGKAAPKKAAPKKAAPGGGRKSAGTGGATKTTAKPGRTKRGGD